MFASMETQAIFEMLILSGTEEKRLLEGSRQYCLYTIAGGLGTKVAEKRRYRGGMLV